MKDTIKKPLSVLQINVRRSPETHEIALALANDKNIDAILIQEPYIYSDRKRRITRRHPSYEAFTPVDDWTVVGGV